MNVEAGELASKGFKAVVPLGDAGSFPRVV